MLSPEMGKEAGVDEVEADGEIPARARRTAGAADGEGDGGGAENRGSLTATWVFSSRLQMDWGRRGEAVIYMPRAFSPGSSLQPGLKTL